MAELYYDLLTEEDWECIMETIQMRETVNSKTGCTLFQSQLCEKKGVKNARKNGDHLNRRRLGNHYGSSRNE